MKAKPLSVVLPQMEHDNCGIGAVADIHGPEESRAIVTDALKIVENLEHRAGKDADGATGDGVGILVQIPHAFFARVCAQEKISIGEERSYGVGMFFFPQQEHARAPRHRKCLSDRQKKEGLRFLGFGAPYPCCPKCWEARRKHVCPPLCRGL